MSKGQLGLESWFAVLGDCFLFDSSRMYRHAELSNTELLEHALTTQLSKLLDTARVRWLTQCQDSCLLGKTSSKI